MERLIHSRLIRILSIGLMSTAALYGLTKSSPANASFFPQLEEFACLADYSGKNLTCTANDIRVSEVTNVTNLDGSTPVECVLGDKVTFRADITVETTANERYGYGIWLPEGNWSAADRNTNNTCSVLIGQTDGPGVDIDGDVCADISKAAGFNPVHVYEDEVITLFCRDDDQSGKAEFNYCASWNQQEYGQCTEDEPTPAGSPSKCRCESFDIDVFIKPEPPTMTKTLSSTNTYAEPGGEYTFDFSFTNESKTSVFLGSLEDRIDVRDEGGLYEKTLNLWGATTIVTAGTSDGVYLTASTCTQPADVGNGIGEVVPSATYSCEFKVYVVDRDLPDLPLTPTQIYDDVVLAYFTDKTGAPVTDGETCPVGVGGAPGQFCSNKQTVQVTNLKPDISVTKTPDKSSVLEPGEDVTFTVVVTNNAASTATWDSPVTLTTLSDSDFDITGDGGAAVVSSTCSTGGSIAANSTYTCQFTAYISGSFGDVAHSNTVTAIATDNENDTDMATGPASVSFADVPSVIALIKTAGGEADGVTHQVSETGDTGNTEPVVYKFEFSVDSNSVDNVIFDTLEDIVDPDGAAIFSDLTSQCNVDSINGNPVTPVALSSGIELAPGEYASCEITLQVQGNAGDLLHNLATIRGTDSDGFAKNASDPASVEFLDVPLQITPEVAMKARVFVRLPNNGVDDVSITTLTIGGANLVDGGGVPDQFQILDETAAMFGPYGASDGPYAFCTTTTINQGDTYECGFTIKLFPGFETGLTDPDIDQQFVGPNGLIFTLDDGDSAPVSTIIDLIFGSNEP